MKDKNIIEQILDFKNSIEWINFENYYNKTSFMEQLDLYRFEDAHTNFLASLFDAQKDVYNLKDYPLRLLIELLALKDKENKYFEQSDFLLGNYELSDIVVETQKYIQPRERIDLLIKFNLNDVPHLILIENKYIYSVETREQCKRYRKIIEEDYKQYDKKFYVFLSLEQNPIISDDHYTKITYQEIIDKVLFPCSLKENNNLCLSVDEYVRGFNALYYNDSIDDFPISYRGKELTIEVMNKYSSFIEELLDEQNDDYFNVFFKSNEKMLNILFVNILKLDGNLNDELLNKVISKIKKKNIRKRNWIIDRSTLYNNTEFLYQFFKFIIKEKGINSINELKPLDEINNWRLLIPKSEIDEEKYKDSYILQAKKQNNPIKIGETEYYYSGWNTQENIMDFIEAVKNKYPEYKDKIGRI